MPRNVAPRIFRSILCPIDFSNNSRAALRYAAMLARLSDAHLLVLYVNDPLLATAAATRPDAEAILASTEDDLRRFVSPAVSKPTPPISATLLTVAGKPAQEILKAAERPRLRPRRHGLSRRRTCVAAPVRLDDGRGCQNLEHPRACGSTGEETSATARRSTRPEARVIARSDECRPD